VNLSEGPPGFVLIHCPTDGEPVFTGLRMAPEDYEDAVLRDIGMRCLRCRKTHIWSKEDSWLETFKIG
jgi:hypothetical protein